VVAALVAAAAWLTPAAPAAAATTAVWSGGTLTVTGDRRAERITIARNPAGTILVAVNGRALAVTGGIPTVANTSLIAVSGGDGRDVIALDESNGALPAAQLDGGRGKDRLIGGSGADTLLGGDDDDVLEGRGGADTLDGQAGRDRLTGGDADDLVFGGPGDDTLVWNPGDDTDLNEGGDGIDVVRVNGGNGAEVFTATANGARVRFDRIDPAPFSIDIGTSERLHVFANGGDDTFSASGNLAPLIAITVDGGAGNDTLLGGNGPDVLRGGAGADFVDGNQGNDIVWLGAGDDVFQWDPGDGNDRVEGEAGDDTLVFNGSAANEVFALTPVSGRARLTRNVGNITVDMGSIETVDTRLLGGSDQYTVGNLVGTGVTLVVANLAATLGGNTGDAATDIVTVEGTSAADVIAVGATGTTATVARAGLTVDVFAAEPATDRLTVNALGGADQVTASGNLAALVHLTVDGGTGNDTIAGGNGADVLIGGDGNDTVDGNGGNDTVFLGAGDDIAHWDPGDGNDVVEGQAGTDTFDIRGSNASEGVTFSANGGRVTFFRNVGNVTLDVDDVEHFAFNALGGTDTISVGNLSATNATDIALRLASTLGGVATDGVADTITVNGTPAADAFVVAGSVGSVDVTGLPYATHIRTADPTTDQLTINGLGGLDTVDTSGLAGASILFTFNQ